MALAKRELFKSVDVCEMAQLQSYVLRSWEAEFPTLGQPASSGGGRVYRRSDVEMVLRIKQLVFGEGLTLAGARRRLEEDADDEPSVASVAVADALGEMARSRLRHVRSGLEAILELLSRDAGGASGELQLVAPSRAARGAAKRSAPAARGTKSAAKTSSGKRPRAS
jgi:DNA-binding transcriptional MerR regulator